MTLSESLNAVEEKFSKNLQANIDGFAKFEQDQIAAREKEAEAAQKREISLREEAEKERGKIIADFDKLLEEKFEKEKANNEKPKKEFEVDVKRKG